MPRSSAAASAILPVATQMGARLSRAVPPQERAAPYNAKRQAAPSRGRQRLAMAGHQVTFLRVWNSAIPSGAHP